MKVGILASGFGSNAQAIFERIASGVLAAEVAVVISNRPGAGVLAKAAQFGVPAILVDSAAYADRNEHEAAILETLRKYECEAIILAGYMRILGKAFVEAFPQRILNLHPALLPAFPGASGIADAMNYGVKLSGASVHFVDQGVDTGPLVIQGAIPVKQGETLDELAGRIHALEHRIFPMALQWLAEKRLSVEGRRVILAPGTRPQLAPVGEMLVWPPLEAGF